MEVSVTEDYLVVEFTDGRILSVPLDWFPTLKKASPEQRNNFRLIGRDNGIHWPDLDEDLSIKGLLRGRTQSKKVEPLGDSDNPNGDDSPPSTNPYR